MRFKIHRAIAIPYKMITVFTAVVGILSLLEGCSVQGYGPAHIGSIGSGLAALGAFFFGLIFLTLSFLAFIMFKWIQSDNHPISVLAAVASIYCGILVFNFDLITDNPFSKNDNELLYLIPDGLIVYSLGIGFVILGVNKLFYSIKDTIKSFREQKN